MIYIMAIPVVEFSKLERFLAKNELCIMQLLNCKNWSSGELFKNSAIKVI